jgi:hypothetical protein
MGEREMIKGIAILLGGIMINYIPAWTADKYEQIRNSRSARGSEPA